MIKVCSCGNADKNYLTLDGRKNRYDFIYDKNTFNENANDSHSAIVSLVSKNSTVLDIGCSVGKLGTILNDYKNCTVDGIEYDVETYNVAKQNNSYRNVYNFSILDTDNECFKKIENEAYDYIIFGDVLEHLLNPWDALVNVINFLKPDGQIIISLPNIGHIDIIRALFNGEFNYNDVGLLDSTHIRFFTANSFADMIRNIADKYHVYFNVNLVKKITFDPEYINDYKEIFDFFNLPNNEEYLTLQNIFTLSKSKNKSSMKFINFNNKMKNSFDNLSLSYIKMLEEKDILIAKSTDTVNRIIIDKNKQLEELNNIKDEQIKNLQNEYKKLYDEKEKQLKELNDLKDKEIKSLKEEVENLKDEIEDLKRNEYE